MKNKLLFVLYIILGISSGSFCQNYSYYQFPKQFPEAYKVDLAAEKAKILSRKFPKMRKWRIREFAEKNANFKQDLFSTGECYLNWNEPEEYLNSILKKIMPDSLKKYNIHVYITRNAEANAFSIYDGTIFLNVGYLANVHNEAGLYFLISHELAHFIYRDIENNFIKSVKLDETSGDSENKKWLSLAMQNADFSRSQETRADSLACEYLSKCGYSVSEFTPDFKSLFEMEELYKASIDKQRHLSQSMSNGKTKVEYFEDKFASHPETKLRIDKIINWSKKLDIGNKHIVANSLFAKTKQTFVYELMHLLLRDNDLKACTEYSFKQFVLNQNDKYYLYSLLESMRMQMYIDTSYANKTFIVCNYLKQNQNKSILSQLQFLFQDSSLFVKAKKSKIVQDENAFLTNKQAFNYFSTFVDKLDYSELYLTIALNNYKINEKEFDRNLVKYLSNPNCQNRVYAEQLKSKRLNDFTGDKQQVLIDNITIFGSSDKLSKAKTMSTELYDKTKDVLQKLYPNYTFDLLLKTEQEDFQKAVSYRELMNSIEINNETQFERVKIKTSNVVYFNSTTDRGDGAKDAEFDVFVFKPELWNYMYDNKLSAINYINLGYDIEGSFFENLIYCFNPYMWGFLLFYYPYLVVINNIPENTIAGYVRSFDRFNKEKKAYFYCDLFRQMSKRNYVKIIKRTLKGLAEK